MSVILPFLLTVGSDWEMFCLLQHYSGDVMISCSYSHTLGE